MNAVRNWIAGITVTAILSALARALTERAGGRSVIRMFSGVCVALAILAPLREGVLPSLRQALQGAHRLEETAVVQGQTLSDELTRRYAAEQAAAYIESQLAATAPHFSVTVTLSAALDPLAVVLRGPASGRDTAVAAAAAALGLPTERVRYIVEEENDENQAASRMDGNPVA